MIEFLRRRRRARTLLCAIARDETPYLAEWTAYHLTIGFDRIVIYDNDSDPPITVAPEHVGRVVVRPWPTAGHLAPQPSAYTDCLDRDGRSCDWMMFLDLDEFLNLKTHASVSAFLAGYPDVSAVAVHWRIFGSDGAQDYEPRPVLRRFTRAAPLEFDPNWLVKTLFRPATSRGPISTCPTSNPTPAWSIPKGAGSIRASTEKPIRRPSSARR